LILTPRVGSPGKFLEDYGLKANDKTTFDAVIDCTPFSVWSRLGKHFQKPWWFDWYWPKNVNFLKYKPHLGYTWLSPNVPMVATLNLR